MVLKFTKSLPAIVLALFLLISTSKLAAADIDADYLGSGPGRFNSFVVSDIDEDGNVEIVIGNYEGHINIIELVGGEYVVEWRSESLGTRLWGLEVADVDSDGTNEIIAGNGEGEVFVFDAKTHELEWKSHRLTRDAHGLAVGDVDMDGENELLVGTGYKTDTPWGTLYIFNGKNFTLEDRIERLGSRIRGIAVHDIDQDGNIEIIFGTGHALGETPGEGYVHVYQFDGEQYVREWKSPDLNGDPQGLLVEDVDGDGNYEIVVGNGYRYHPGYLNIFRYSGGMGVGTPEIYEKVFESDDIGPKAYGLDAADIDGDGIVEIVVGNQPGYIWVFDGSTREVEWKSDLLGSDILGIRLYDIDRDGTVEIIAAQGGYQGKSDFTSAYTTPHIFIIDGKTYAIEERIGEPDYLAWSFQIAIISLVIVLLVLLNIFVKKKKVQRAVVEKPKEVVSSSES